MHVLFSDQSVAEQNPTRSEIVSQSLKIPLFVRTYYDDIFLHVSVYIKIYKSKLI